MSNEKEAISDLIGVPREKLQSHVNMLCRAGLMFTEVEGLLASIDYLRALLAKPAAQHQGEPVDWIVVSPEGMEPVKGLAYSLENAERYAGAGWKVTPVYIRPAEQPAPVAGVLPELRKIRGENDAHRVWHSQGWNACLDEVARLNPKRPVRSSPPTGSHPSGTHRDNDGLDEWRKR